LGAKEAYFKRIGSGIPEHLNRLSIIDANNGDLTFDLKKNSIHQMVFPLFPSHWVGLNYINLNDLPLRFIDFGIGLNFLQKYLKE
jgi:hypothetical protein